MLNAARYICLAGLGLFGFHALSAVAEEKAISIEEGSQANSGIDAEANLPKSVAVLLTQGFEFHGTFDVPGNVMGYALSYGNDPVAAYVTSDNDYAFVGTLLDSQGNEVMGRKLQSLVLGPILEKAWNEFETTRFITEGGDNAPHIVYTLTDPNCPYCNALWNSTRPLIEEGVLQLRHLMVGVLSEDSIRKSAAILESDNPASALEAHEESFQTGGIEPVEPSEESRALLEKHAKIMREAGATGTPTSYYRDEGGHVQSINGAVSTDRLRGILGIE